MKKDVADRALRILLFCDSLTMIAGAMIGPIYAFFVEKVGGDLLSAGLTGGIFAFAAGLATLISGKYADKLKDKKLMLAVGYLIMGVGFMLYMLANSVISLLLVQVVIGFAGAVHAPVFDALYSRNLTKGKMASEWGSWEAANYFSVAVGSTVGGIIAYLWGFNAIFILMGGLCFVSAGYVYLLPKSCV